MAEPRTPTLDERLSDAARTMSAREAYRAANALLTGKAPLRTPVLSDRIGLARREFDNPAYVSAILRNIAGLDIAQHYTVSELAKIARTGDGSQIDTGSFSAIASGLVDEHKRLGNRSSEYLKKLDNRYAALLAPFCDIKARLEINSLYAYEFWAIRNLDIPGDTRVTSAYDYRSLACDLHLEPTADTFHMLRFCLMPANRYSMGVRRLVRARTSEPPKELEKWMVGSYLDYSRPDGTRGYRRRIELLERNVLRPIASIGKAAGIVREPGTQHAPTLF